MGVSAENMSLGASLPPGLIDGGLWPPENRWVARALRQVAEACGASLYYLVAIDREGTAHPLAGTLPREAVGPQILEALESPLLWREVRPQQLYEADQLRVRPLSWPAESELGARFVKDGKSPLGVLLIQATPRARPVLGERRDGRLADTVGPRRAGETPSDEAEPAADPLLELILRHWRLGQEAQSLGGFTQALVGAQQGGVMAIDVQGRVTYLSRAGAGILGIAAREALGADCARIMRLSVEGEHPLVLGLSGKLERIELYITDHQGRDLPVFLSLSRVLGPHGACQGLVCFFRDLSEERAVEQEARRRERLAVIGELAAGAAHEIRNPLTGIANCAQVLQMRLAEQEGVRKMADLILRETRRLDHIITSLLSFARPGQPQMRETRIDEVVRAALELEEPVCREKGVRCEIRISGMIPTIFVDPDQIQQVVVNLLRNATDAMPDGGELSLEVSVVRRHRHARRRLGRRATDRVQVPSTGPLSRYVRIRVKDTGMGIARETLPRIFDPFFTTRSEGTGLGLSVSQSIIQEHGGYLSVQSVHGKGTVFELDLPVERRQGERRK